MICSSVVEVERIRVNKFIKEIVILVEPLMFFVEDPHRGGQRHVLEDIIGNHVTQQLECK